MKVEINWNKFDSQKYRPLVVEEIPDFKPGSILYDDYWDAQDYRCLKGFKPAPYMPHITGEHYFYLNMCKIKLLERGATRKTTESPFYRELDRRIFDEIYNAKKGKYGIIVGKPRRVGLSYIGAATSTYELLFYKDNEIGVAAGQEDKAQDFYDKVKMLLENIRPEYRSGTITKNQEVIKLGYQEYINKQKVDKGLKSQMYMKTMYAKPTGFEGKSLSMVIFEEAGLFEDIVAAFKSTEPCFKEGMIQFGTPIVYGTGGDMEKGSKGYKEMWYAKRSIYNLKPIFISATDYYPGDGIPDEVTGKAISFFDFRTGKTDSKAAFEYIMKERQEKDGSEGFIKHIQSYPLKESDIFIKTSGGLLNRKKLNAQIRNQDNCPFQRKTGRLEWKTNDPATLRLVAIAKTLKEIDKIHFLRGSKIEFIEDEELGTIHKILDPIKQTGLPYHPDIGGCDSYDDGNTVSEGSLGATIIYRTFYSINQPHDIPIAYILDRGTGDSDDEFYSNTMRLSIYYGVKMLVEHTKVAIIGHYMDVGADTDYLQERPNLAGTGYVSRAQNLYGFKMSNQHAWALTLRLLKQEVNLNFNNIWFIEILEHLLDYGETNADLGSAFGMLLVQKLDMFGEMTEGLEHEPEEVNIFDGMGYYDMINGQLEYTTYGEQRNNQDEDPFSIHNMRTFDPEYDLDGQERVLFEQAKVDNKKAIVAKRKEVLSRYSNDVMAFTLEEHNARIKEN